MDIWSTIMAAASTTTRSFGRFPFSFRIVPLIGAGVVGAAVVGFAWAWKVQKNKKKTI